MNALSEALLYVVQTLGILYLTVVLLRFILQMVRADFYNPLSQFAVRATQPLLKPLRRLVPSIRGLDTSSLLLAFLIQALLMVLVLLWRGAGFDVPHLLMWAVLGVASWLLKIFWVAMIVMVIVSWVAPNPQNPAAQLAWQISEPILAPFRRLLPNLGGLDISPILAFMAIHIVQRYLMPELAEYTLMPGIIWDLI